MSDNKNIKQPLDGKRIDINDPSEIWNWANALGVTEKELVQAVESVGTSASAVREFLNKKKK